MLNVAELYFGGDMEASIALCGEVAGRIDASRPVADIVADCARECLERLAELHAQYLPGR